MALSEYEKFNLIKPLPKGWPKNEIGIPYLMKQDFSDVNWNLVNFTSYSNLKSIVDKNNSIMLLFQFDKSINCAYNDIFKFAINVSDFCAVATPDYSAYRNMEPWRITESVVHGLWVGAWLQHLGLRIIPTITWAEPNTFDICFNFIPQKSVVAISTVGVSNSINCFLNGYDEMMTRINPDIVIVRGNYIPGMYGNLLFVGFDETFNIKKNFEQISLFENYRIIKIPKEDKYYGWKR